MISTQRRWNGIAILCAGIFFSAAGFFAGRFSSQQKISADSKKSTVVLTNRVETEKISASLPIENNSPTASGASNWDEKRWNELLSQPGSPVRNSKLAALLEKLGALDPDSAMAMAGAQDSLKLREQLTQAALHGWARTSPTNAAQWALSLSDANKCEAALSTVFAGAVAANPDAAIRLGNFVISQNPNEAVGYGSRLIDALCDGGDFQKAAQMASGGDSQTQSSWMAEAYSRWAEFQPEEAAQAAADVNDPAEKNLALHGIIGGWSQADPAGLVQFVTQLPADTDRDSLLSQSLERWVKTDPATASQWINTHDAAPAFDQGVVAVATMETLPPTVAVTWAESVTDPQLRSETLVSVLRNWLTADPSAAENYFNATKNLLPADREEIGEVIASMNGQTAGQ